MGSSQNWLAAIHFRQSRIECPKCAPQWQAANPASDFDFRAFRTGPRAVPARSALVSPGPAIGCCKQRFTADALKLDPDPSPIAADRNVRAPKADREPSRHGSEDSQQPLVQVRFRLCGCWFQSRKRCESRERCEPGRLAVRWEARGTCLWCALRRTLGSCERWAYNRMPGTL